MYYAIIIALVAIDQTVKYLVSSNLFIGQSIPLIDGVLHITYVSNDGAAFSIMRGQTVLLTVIPAVVTVALLIYLHKNRGTGHFALLLSISLICSGGLGNLIDRARFGEVVDFIDFRVFPVFNVADICVCCGCGLLLIYLVFLDKDRKKGRADGDG